MEQHAACRLQGIEEASEQPAERQRHPSDQQLATQEYRNEIVPLLGAFDSMRGFRRTNPDPATPGLCLITLMLRTYLFMTTAIVDTGVAQMTRIVPAMTPAHAELRAKGPTDRKAG